LSGTADPSLIESTSGKTLAGRFGWILGASAFLLTANGVGACGARTQLELPADNGSAKKCEQFSALASLAKLDVFMLIDSSGSMESVTAVGITKWEAVESALMDFLTDPATEGSDVGLTFMPQINADVPTYCHDDSQCMLEGACTPHGECLPSKTSICQTDAQCIVAGDHCERLGTCEGAAGVFCQLANATCGALGDCLPAGTCENRTQCEPEAYNIIGLAKIPEQTEGLLFALENRERSGFTPTLPAVRGVLGSAAKHALDNPRNKVVAIVATDGLPTTCDPELPIGGVPAAIENLAEVATEAHEQSIQTFVIGVFAPKEAAFAAGNLDAIARAGGSNEAFIITTDTQVSQLFLEALEDVRRSNVCEFALPAEAQAVDLTQIRVQLTGADGTKMWIDWIGEDASCGTGPGFYFDRDPTGDVAPGRVILCPASCASEPESIFVSCKSLIPPDPLEP
jgi:hypothetical protein